MYNDFKDYYKALGLSFPATEAEIKAAFRRLARSYHPDRHPDEPERYTALFQELNEAYATLSDPYEKELYDRRYRQTVLGEGPQYTYHEDDTPQDTYQYRHTYTRRKETNIPLWRILIIGFVLMQLFRSLSNNYNTPSREYRPLDQSSVPVMTEEVRRLLQSATEQEARTPAPDTVPLEGKY